MMRYFFLVLLLLSSGIASADTFIDRFDQPFYNNNNGTHFWSSAWQESDDGVNGNASTTGNVRIIAGRLQLRDGNNHITRSINMNGYNSASITFDYEFNTSGSDDDVKIQVRTNNGSWNDVYLFDGNSSQEGTGSVTVDISSYIGEQVYIRIRTMSGFDANDDMFFDNFTVTADTSAPVTATFLDTFSSVSYSRQDGNKLWATDWIETNDGSSSPSSGLFRVVGNELRIHGPNRTIRRGVNLASYRAATLTFDYTLDTNNSDDIAYLDAYNSATGQWNNLRRFDDNTATSGTVTIDLSGYLRSGTQLRFRTSSGFDSGNQWWADHLFVDDFAINALPNVIACPDTSSYNQIFADNYSSNQGVWTAVNFDRNVSVWPGDSILNDPDEDQSVDFSISSGKLNVEGNSGGNAYGNNEYGAILHDLSDQFYTTSDIDEYTIEVDLTADTTDINNDVGVIFGYQDDRNYYVIKWTKFGSYFSSDTNYPGVYRNLDLIKVSNGIATTLDSLSNYVGPSVIPIKITVNGDGINICIDGAGTLSASSEQPSIYQYGYFTYENEDGVEFDNLVVKCNGCQPLQCPTTSAYTLIHSDNFSTSSSNYEAVNFNRNISVWPNDSIENDNAEDQNVQFEVSGGRMKIEGALGANVNGNNEYGAVLHDLSKQNYDPSLISQYSIEADMYSGVSYVNNNDVGMVFGYQDDSNYYVLKWTKIGTLFSDPLSAAGADYPGVYRNLDLIKVSNGVASTLASKADYAAPLPIRVKITVNADGISVCIDGAAVFVVSTEMPPIYQYGFFSYENEEGLQFDNLEVRCNGCTTVNNVDHYRIVHPTQGLTCATYPVTVVACTNADCSSVSTETVKADLRKTYGSSGDDLVMSVDTDTGSQTLTTFNHPQAGTITFALSNEDPDGNNDTKCYTGSATGTEVPSCEMTLADSGFIVSASDFESAKAWQQFTVQAVEKDNASNTCAPGFSGNKDVDITFNYNNPSTVRNAAKLEFSLVGGNTPAAPNESLQNNVASKKTLSFSNVNATANFYVNYDEVGQLKLTVADGAATSVVIAGSDDFVVYPTELTLGLSDDSGKYLGAVDNPTHFADQDFQFVIAAWNADGTVTQNYNPGNLQLAPRLVSPTTSGVANVALKYADGATVTASNASNNWQTVQTQLANSFGTQGYVYDAATFNNVGTLRINVRDTNYFGYQIESENGAEVQGGRFTPAYFSIDNVTTGSTVALKNTTGDISYIGQDIGFVNTPTYEYVAKTYLGATATNYVFDMDQFDFDEANYTDATSSKGTSGYPTLAFPNKGITVTDATQFDGKVVFTLNESFTYTKPATVFAPIDLAVNLTFLADELKDGDGIGYDSDGVQNPSANELPVYEAYTALNNITGARLLYGRLFMENAAGVESANLLVPTRVEYWDGSSWQLSDQDSLSNFSNLTGTIYDISNNATGLNLIVDTENSDSVTREVFNNGSIPTEYGLFAEAPGIRAQYRLELDNVPAWLNMDWDLDGTIEADEDKVSANLSFGSFAGNKRIIYKRER